MSTLRRINRDLKADFGPAKGDALGRAQYRMAMTNETEVRIGSVAEFTESGIYRKTVSGAHRLPKYNYGGHFDNLKWALERLSFAELPEVPETKTGTYEPLYVFPQRDGKPFLPPYETIRFILVTLLYGVRKTVSDYAAEDAENFKKEVARTLEILDDQRSYMQGMLQDQEAITMPTCFEGSSPLLKEVEAKATTEEKKP